MQNTNSSRRRAKSEFFFFIFFQNLWKTVNLSSGFLFTSRDGHANRIGILIVLVISKVFVSLPYKHSAMRGQVSQLSTLKRRRSRISVDTAPFFFRNSAAKAKGISFCENNCYLCFVMEVDKENKPTARWIIRNVILAGLFFAVLLIAAQLGLKAITRHNKVITVPDFTNLSVADARLVAKRNAIRTEVVDSVYVKRMEKGHVFSQNPAAGSQVKKNRTIKLTINSNQTKMVKMPNLVGYSLRQAKTEIMAAGLTVGKLAYREDLATNNVLDQFIKGKYVAPGTQVEAETPVDLLLGLSPDDNQTFIPYLVGFTLPVARDNIFENSLNLGNVSYDETVQTYQDTLSAVVYQQTPAYHVGAPAAMGTAIHLKLTTSQAKIAAR